VPALPVKADRPRVLICDDDAELCALLDEYLSLNGFDVATVGSAESALETLSRDDARCDVLVLDVMLPGRDGLSALREIRAAHRLPILMLSARGEPVDRIVGLELGADDYLAKPCVPRELLARLQALLRRGRDSAAAPGADVSVRDLRLKPPERRAWIAGVELALTGAEFSVLLELARQAGTIVTREDLTQRGLHRPLERYDRAIDVHVSRLRRKLREASAAAPDIEAVRGAGYILR
jgi:DNA-binding response OmpR family regulator